MPQVSFNDLIAGAQAGQLVSFPTDTVPALAARPDRASLIFAAKQREAAKPLILMAADIADIWDYVSGSPTDRQIWHQVADRYWPGALTLVLPASDRIPLAMNPTDPTSIGLRVPDQPIARQILSLTQPLATTSINRSGQPPLLTIEAINADFPEVLTLRSADLATLNRQYNLPSMTYSGVPSTVAKWTETGWQVLRQGSVTFEP